MSEEIKTRTLEEVGKEYSHTCAIAGDLQYRLIILKRELDSTNSKLEQLNIEAVAIGAAQKKGE